MQCSEITVARYGGNELDGFFTIPFWLFGQSSQSNI